LKIDEKKLESLFKKRGGISHVLEEMNLCYNKPKGYISRYYAPKKDNFNGVDYKKERLFYTRENALRIDSMRDQIEKWYPSSSSLSEDESLEKSFLIALLLYECSVHTNTSGVFKAYHKGFGGHGKNALSRILKPIKLSVPPLLCDSHSQSLIYRKDVLELIQSISFNKESIVYLDPPYKEHQYGSNYHLLNTIALWDKLPVSNKRKKDGSLKSKAGIRKDWVKTRSSFCYKTEATESFKQLITHIQAKYILLSYSTDGIIPFLDLCEIVFQKGKVSIVLNEYIKYRGGKKSSGRVNKNIEFIIIIDTQKISTKEDQKKMQEIIEYQQFLLLFNKKYQREKLEQFFSFKEDKIIWKEKNIELFTAYKYEIAPLKEEEPRLFQNYAKIKAVLEQCVCHNVQKELEEIDKRLSGFIETPKEVLFWFKRWLSSLKSLAHKKNKDLFIFWKEKRILYKKKHPKEWQKIESSFTQLEDIFYLRINN
jgi:adenine-specific DNA-methyltransferase